MLKNFETDLDRQGVTRMVIVRDHTTVRSIERTDLLVEQEEWTWRELQAYVVTALTQRFGAHRNDDPQWPVKQASIFKSFVGRWGPGHAARIARYAIEVCDARWQGRPVTVTSFCKGTDPYFASPIAERLNLS